MLLSRKKLLAITVLVEGGLILLSMLLLRDSISDLWIRINFSWGGMVDALLLCLPMFAALYFTMHSEWRPMVQLRNEMDEKLLPLFAKCKRIDLAIIAFFAGVGEELFFRGWMQAVLVERSGLVIGILITSLIFGLLHSLSTVYALYAFITGIYLGVIYFALGNLFVVMAIHAIYDFVALIYLTRKRKLD